MDFETVIEQSPRFGSNPMWLTHAAESEYNPPPSINDHPLQNNPLTRIGCKFRFRQGRFGASHP